MRITRRAVVAGLAAAAVVPLSEAQAAQARQLCGPVYGRGVRAVWPVVRPWMWSRWHFHEHEPGKVFIRHSGSGVTFAAVEFRTWFGIESLPGAVRELRPVSSPSRPVIDPQQMFAIGHAARFTAANSWLLTACRRDRPGGAVYFDWSVDDPSGDYFGDAATASIEDAPPLLPGVDLSACAGAEGHDAATVIGR